MAVGVKKTPVDLDAALEGMVYEKNVEIPTRDGSYVLANVFRPDTTETVPALLCVSLYGKDLHEQDGFPEIWNEMLETLPNMKEGSTLSLHTHETNDPEIWVRKYGYACVRVDVPGSGKSPGLLDPLSPTEARATYDAIEWAAAQPWCNGKVGMTGISYLAMTQWRVASEQPPHLACILPWEGVSDYYRDWNRHGGIISTFFNGWFPMSPVILQHGNANSPWVDLDDGAPIGGPLALSDEELHANRIDPAAELRARELDDDWWRERSADLRKITVPFLSAANWGGHGLHLRGNMEPFIQSPAEQKWLEIHGGNHRDGYYLPEGEALHKQFFDHFLKGVDNGWQDRPRVLLNIRHADETFVPRPESEWPLARTSWEKYYLDPDAGLLGPTPPKGESSVSYPGLGEGVRLRTAPFAEETEITGPLVANLHVSSSTDDMDVFVTLRAFRPDGTEVMFHGSSDPAVPLTQGWLRVSHRKLDPERSTPWRPFHAHDELQKLTPGQIYEVQVELWPTCLVFPAGYQLELLIEGVDFARTDLEQPEEYLKLGKRMSEAAGDGNDRSNVFRGSGPALHNDWVDRPEAVFGGTNTIHTGGRHDSYLLVPVIPSE